MPVRPSVRPHGTFKSPLKGFSLFDIWVFFKICQEILKTTELPNLKKN
jgi:hypothetical protein